MVLGNATRPLARRRHSSAIPEPHYHLSMIGVLPEVRRTGSGATGLLEGLHEVSSAADPGSIGVTLSTENPEQRISLYQKFGYEIIGQTKIGDLETWSFFRPDR